jgi:hypothetical protein
MIRWTRSQIAHTLANLAHSLVAECEEEALADSSVNSAAARSPLQPAFEETKKEGAGAQNGPLMQPVAVLEPGSFGNGSTL